MKKASLSWSLLRREELLSFLLGREVSG